jgi:hypothetical protein
MLLHHGLFILISAYSNENSAQWAGGCGGGWIRWQATIDIPTAYNSEAAADNIVDSDSNGSSSSYWMKSVAVRPTSAADTFSDKKIRHAFIRKVSNGIRMSRLSDRDCHRVTYCILHECCTRSQLSMSAIFASSNVLHHAVRTLTKFTAWTTNH